MGRILKEIIKSFQYLHCRHRLLGEPGKLGLLVKLCAAALSSALLAPRLPAEPAASAGRCLLERVSQHPRREPQRREHAAYAQPAHAARVVLARHTPH